MGFAIKTPKLSSAAAAAPKVEPDVVTETVQYDTTRDYDQRRANKRGLLSTILSNPNRNLSATGRGNTTLG